MRVIVLGGAGAMGRRTVEDLVASPDISRITVADINKKSADRLVAGLEATTSLKLDALILDAFQQDEVIRVICNYDVVVSALGPYHVFEESMVKAALEAKVDYISICDEWDVVDKIIRLYNEDARNKGVRVICGMGASPGITNVAALCLSNKLDRVSRINISVWLPLDTGAGAAAIKHGVYIMTGQMATWRDSARQMIKPCTESIRTEFPGIGQQQVWNMGHSEPVTLPIALKNKGLEAVNFYMGFGMGSILLTGPARLGWYEQPMLNKALTKAFISIENLLSAKKARPGASRIDVWGESDSRETHLTAFGVSTMQDSTALALSVGAQLLAKNDIVVSGGGVYAPESIFDPAICLKWLWKKGIRIYSDIELSLRLI